jgi:hypothetical protein
MRLRRFAAAVAASGIAVLAGVVSARPVAQKGSPIDGVWDYAIPGLRGQSFYQDGHYVFFTTQPDSAPGPGTLTEAAQSKLYRAMALQAGTFTVSDSIVTMQQMYGKDPRKGPSTWRWSFVLKGDTITYHYPLDANGHAPNAGRSIRARSNR